MCDLHYQRYRKWGDPYWHDGPPTGMHNASWKNHDICYGTAHERVRDQRGKASDRLCCSCGQQAQHWAYDHGDPDERSSQWGPYSLDLDHYQAMCVPCHKQFDLARLAS